MLRDRYRRFLIGILALAAIASLIGPARADEQILYDRKSQFNRIIVGEDSFRVRRLYFEPDGAVQSALDLEAPLRLVLPYARATMCGLALVQQPRRMLIVGLGGGCMPMYLRHYVPDAQIDVAELDPDILRIAKQYFQYKEDEKLKTHIGDGRKFIETTANKYDIIFLDAYGTDDIPYSLTTREFLKAVRSKLADGGIVVANVWGSLDNKLYPSMIKTYRDVFDELHIIRAPRSENRIFLAIPRKIELTERALAGKADEAKAKLKLDVDLSTIIESGYEIQRELPPDAKVLVDAEKP